MLWLLTTLATAAAGVTRFAVFVGNDEGATNSPTLYFAESDAEKMHHVFTTVGGVEDDNTRVLLGRDRNSLLSVLGVGGLRDEIAEANARGDDTVFIFYYSGHADDTRLQLGSTWLTWTELDRLLELSGADVRMALLDACQSGAMTREKGGQRADSFVHEISERLNVTGQVVITSSAGNEASQESDEIGGGYFTHFFASALTGTADTNHDDEVTLNEAYQYVHDETIFHTAGTRSGTQTPNYGNHLAGSGDLVLADLGSAQATLVLPDDLAGRFAIFDLNRRQFVAEVSAEGAEQRLALSQGAYLVQIRYPTHLLSAEVQLRDKGTVTVSSSDFRAVEYENDQAKGAIDKQIRKSNLPKLSLHVAAGQLAFPDERVQSGYFPPIPIAGIAGRWHWRPNRLTRGERWVGADIMAGSGGGELSFTDLTVDLPVRLHGTTAGVTAGFATRRRFVQVGGGIRLAGVYLMREFPGQDLENQDLVTLSPGFVGWLGLRPGRIEIDLEVRSQILPYTLDDPDLKTNFSEGLLMIGYRF
ncbi:MAG: hypothetical protein ACI8RZ_005815 [Myxococcota bacterium]|jgi:hypothetical protein